VSRAFSYSSYFFCSLVKERELSGEVKKSMSSEAIHQEHTSHKLFHHTCFSRRREPRQGPALSKRSCLHDLLRKVLPRFLRGNCVIHNSPCKSVDVFWLVDTQVGSRPPLHLLLFSKLHYLVLLSLSALASSAPVILQQNDECWHIWKSFFRSSACAPAQNVKYLFSAGSFLIASWELRARAGTKKLCTCMCAWNVRRQNNAILQT
jgi:hypothetical protein